MSELEYSSQYAVWLTAAGITPNSNPINLRGVVHQILQNLGGAGAVSSVAAADSSVVITPTTGAVTVSRGALTGAVTSTAGSTTTALASTITAAGPIGGASTIPVITYNAAGQLTAVTTATPAKSTAYTYSAITADPNPAVVGTYYHVVLASTGNFTLPTTPVTGSFVRVKNRSATTTMNIVGTVDTNASFTVGPGLANEFVYNGTDWDAT